MPHRGGTKGMEKIMKKYDVAVVGGGFSGVAAALAAARAGSDVILIEKSNCLGGAAVNCLVNPFMPYSTKIDGKRVELSAGIFKEITERLAIEEANEGYCFSEEKLKYILNEMVLESGVRLLFHATLSSVDISDGHIGSASFTTKCGEVKIEAKQFIDCTGDAQLAFLSGCPTVLGRPKDHLCQPMTLCFRVGNVDVKSFFASRPRLQEAWKAALAEGKLLNPRENILVFTTPTHNILHFNTTRVVKKNPTDPFDLTEAEILARRQVHEVFSFMKEHADGFSDAVLLSTAMEIGVRESRMIVGEYVLTEEDCRSFTKFGDGIAACNYDIDIHNPEGTGTSHYYFPVGEYYTVPYRSLIPKGADNLLVAGRCISSDHGAQASYRIMPTVCTLGQAAGEAAAMAVSADIRPIDIDTAELRARLRKGGAFI